MSDQRPDDFDEVVRALQTSFDAEIARERRLVTPDFAAVVEAARQRDPEVVSEAAVRETGEFAPIVELVAERNEADGEDELSDAQFDAWIADARALAEADVAARRLEGVPPLPMPRAPEPRRWGSVLALAAVLIGVAVGVPRLLDAFVDSNYVEAETSHNQAEYIGPEAQPEDGVRVRLQPEASVVEPISQQAFRRSDPPPDPGTKLDKREQPQPRVRAPRPGADDVREQTRDRIAQLDAEAQALWAKGDLAGAEKHFREIIKVAGKSHRRYADLAYGDLFTLARQRKDDAGERSLWNEYLERFPSGRYADDARAGLCRRAAHGEREECWQAYLDDFPRGIHTRAAERALGKESP